MSARQRGIAAVALGVTLLRTVAGRAKIPRDRPRGVIIDRGGREILPVTMRKPLVVLLSVLVLSGAASAATSVAFDTASAYAGTNDDSI